MKHSSMFTPTARGTPSRWTSGLLAICCMTLSSCAAKTDRGPQITLLDFKAQNVERLHSGIERLVGDDSAGVAAMEYVRNYEDDLATNYPVGYEPPEPKNEPADINAELSALYYWRRLNTPNPVSTIPPMPQKNDPAIRKFKSFLDGQRMTAMTDLRKNHEEFQAKGTMSAAKMGLVNAYVAATAAPSAGDLNLIVELVDPMLEALTPR